MMDIEISSFMPIAESTRMATNKADVVNTTFYIKLPMHKLPTTQDMVNDALETLYTVRGVSLYKIKKFIEEKYCFVLNTPRKTRIKNYMHDLLQSGALLNVTGKGLAGSVRLNRQHKTKTKSPISQKQPRQQPKLRVAVKVATIKKKQPSKQTKKQQNQQLKTPPNKLSSMQARRAIQNAPFVTVQHGDPFTAHGLNSIEIDATPRSSGGAKPKRKLHTANPPNPSQIFEASDRSDLSDSDHTIDAEDLDLSTLPLSKH